MSKRTIESFFARSQPANAGQAVEKKPRLDDPPGADRDAGSQARAEHQDRDDVDPCLPSSNHETYPWPVSGLPVSIDSVLESITSTKAPQKHLTDKPDLDVLYFQPFFPRDVGRELYLFLRRELFFYRVEYSIKRDSFETKIKTPRYTTVFGIDNTARFDEAGGIIDARTRAPLPEGSYKRRPRPAPAFLLAIKYALERALGVESKPFNFILVNYYADTSDSISFHSDDEKFLGADPTIGSLSLGSTRDFLMKHKSEQNCSIKLPLATGDMLVMQNRTQTRWLHSIPKRAASTNITGAWHGGGRINITFRRALDKSGTGNYYRYNVGDGPVFKWNNHSRKMEEWKKPDP